MQIRSYDEIQSWKKGIELTKKIYTLTSNPPLSKDWSLCDQMRRAAVSISSNIAEGFERNNNNEFTRYLVISKGSAGELRTQIIIAYHVGYLSESQYLQVLQEINHIMIMLGSFITYLKKLKASKTRKHANPPTR
ncbi:MAG: four helix bundle protein [Candidatus Uhrbacteria bacterium]|nr:four helix bundle protein [Candidatus Uhrbacteria bacterium]